MPATTTPTYQVLVDDLKALGVEQVFGLMSDDTAVFATALDSAGIRFYGARHENNAVAMAEGYSYATGRLGVAVIGRGPATANGLHAATYASRAGLAGADHLRATPRQAGGSANGIGPGLQGLQRRRRAGGRRHPHLRRHQPGDRARRAGRRGGGSACRAARRPCCCRSTSSSPRRTVAEAPPPPRRRAAAAAAAAPRPQAIEAAAALLRQSRKPLILAGLGAHRAGAKAEIEQLADRIGALLATTARGKDMFRGHPANLGIVGSFSHSAARRMIADADCVLVFGAGLNLLTMSFGHSLPKVPLIQVDSDRSHIGRWHPADVAVVGDARLAAQALLAALPAGSNAERPFRSDETLRFLAELRHRPRLRAGQPRRARSIRGRSAWRSRSCCRPGAAWSTTPATSSASCPISRCPIPGRFKLTSDFASIGLGFGTALGRRQGAARRDHRAGDRRRRLPDDAWASSRPWCARTCRWSSC